MGEYLASHSKGGSNGWRWRQPEPQHRRARVEYVFVNNEAVDGDGGALFIEKCEQVEVQSCTIGSQPHAGRPATGGNQAQNGGGIFVRGSQQVTLGGVGEGNTVTENAASVDGGGVALWKSTKIRTERNLITGNLANGANPWGAPSLDANGNLYGTTIYGGTGACSDTGCGVVWEITP